jgi:RES domain-containing protein
MIVYRLGRTKYASILDGEGARLHGGRWNQVGTACIYTSESRALAVLEYTVNTNIADIPRSLSITTIEIPDEILFHAVPSLPGDWRDAPAPVSAKEFGTKALLNKTHSVHKFPSAIIPQEFNYLLDPLYSGSAAFRIIDVQDFVYDIRIKTA